MPFLHSSTTEKRIDAIYPTPPFVGLALFLPLRVWLSKLAQGAFKTALHLCTKRNISFSQHDTPHPAFQCRLVDREAATSLLLALTFFSCVAACVAPSGKSVTVILMSFISSPQDRLPSEHLPVRKGAPDNEGCRNCVLQKSIVVCKFQVIHRSHVMARLCTHLRVFEPQIRAFDPQIRASRRRLMVVPHEKNKK